MTYQAELYAAEQERESARLRIVEREREGVVVGYANGFAGLSLRDRATDKLYQRNLTGEQIDQLVADLLDARRHLDFAVELDRILPKGGVH